MEDEIETPPDRKSLEVVLQVFPSMALYALPSCFPIYNVSSFLPDQIFELSPTQKVECAIQSFPRALELAG